MFHRALIILNSASKKSFPLKRCSTFFIKVYTYKYPRIDLVIGSKEEKSTRTSARSAGARSSEVIVTGLDK